MHHISLSTVFVSLLIALVVSDCPHQRSGLTTWSSWSGRPTVPGQNVTISPTDRILLDTSPPDIYLLDIYGELIFSPNVANLTLRAYFIYVRGQAHLWIGNIDCEYTGTATIVLLGSKTDFNPDGFGTKVLAGFPGSQIDIHVAVRRPVWTVLAQSANIGDTSITLVESVSWQPGDRIVIASTDYPRDSFTQDEVVTITSVNGATVQFTPSLRYRHYGKIWQGDSGDQVDMRGEVGLLTRNVIIYGDPMDNSWALGWGGHVMVLAGSQMRIRGVELFAVGQALVKGRYPIHYHVGGDQSASFVKENSIHDTFQRCVVLHGVNNLTVQNNVAFNSSGHCYFIEDANEQHNKLIHNLGILARKHNLLTSDSQPAVFWVTNPTNDLIDNVAVSGTFGFWYSLPMHPLGMADNPNTAYMNWPKYSLFGRNEGNKAHSNHDSGLFIDDGLIDDMGNTIATTFQPRDVNFLLNYYLGSSASQTPLGDVERLIRSGQPVTAIVKDFVGYKNRLRGIWARSDRTVIYHAMLSDNRAGINTPGEGNLIERCVIVGDSDNVGTPVNNAIEQDRSRPYPYDCCVNFSIVGWQNYDAGGGNLITDVHFYNFQDYNFMFINSVRKAGALSGIDGPNVIVPRNKFFRLKFTNVQNRVVYPPASYETDLDAMKGTIIVDSDGSITGMCGATITGSSPIGRYSECVYDSGMWAWVCPPNKIPQRQISIQDDTNVYITGEKVSTRASTKGSLTRLTDHVTLTMDSDVEYEIDYGSVSTISVSLSYSANLVVFHDYFLKFGSSGQLTRSRFSIVLIHWDQNEYIRLAIPFPPTTRFNVTHWYDNRPFTQVMSRDELGYGKYYFDDSLGLLWVHVENPQRGYDIFYGAAYQSAYFPIRVTAWCPGGNCTVSNVPDPSSITGTSPPSGKEVSLCELNGPIPAYGQVVWTDTGASKYVIFDENFQNSWTISGSSWNISSEQAADGSYSIKARFGNYGGLYFYRRNSQEPLDLRSYTHFELKVRAGTGEGDIYLVVIFSNSTAQLKVASTALSNYLYTNQLPVNDQQWYTIRVPISDLGIDQTSDVRAFYLSNNRYRPIKVLYLDSISFGNYNTRIDPISNYFVTSTGGMFPNYPTSPPPQISPNTPLFNNPSNPSSPRSEPSTRLSSSSSFTVSMFALLTVIFLTFYIMHF